MKLLRRFAPLLMLVAGCLPSADSGQENGGPVSFPIARIVEDNRSASTSSLMAGEWEFAIGRGSGRHGLNVVRVWSNGSARAVFRDSSGSAAQWRRASFTVKPEVVAGLRERLVSTGFSSLAREYHADVHDGVQWCLLLKGNGTEKRVYCNNHFPAEVQRIAAFADLNVPMPSEAESIGHETAEDEAADLWP